MRWRPITQSLYHHWGHDAQGFRDFVATFGFDRFTLPTFDTIAHMGAFLRCEKGAGRAVHYTRIGYTRSDIPPMQDHSLVFQKAGTTRRMLVYNPYPLWGSGGLQGFRRELENWCNERDIIYVLCPQSKSFYNPGNTYMIMLMSPDTYVDCLAISGFPQNLELEEEHHD